MKKLISFFLILLVILSFAGCNRDADEKSFDAFESTVTRVGYTSGGQFFDDALNAEKVNNKKPKSLPIYRVNTKEELEGFKSTYDSQLYISHGNESKTAFSDKVSKYDDKFFEENSLLIVYVISGSGSYEYDFDSISITKDSVCVHVIRTNDPKFGTCDMAGWLITVAVSDSLLKNCTSYDAVYDGYKGNETTSPEPEPEINEVAPSEYNFTGRLLEKLEGNSCLMEVTDVGNGNFAVGNEVAVNSSMLSHFNVGDLLNIQFDGKVTMSIPPQVVNVSGVTLIIGASETEETKASSDSTPSEPAKITVTRVGSGYACSFSDNALNVKTLSNKQEKHHPIFRVNTRAELESFITSYDSQLNLSNKFAKVAAQYDDEFFKENSLLLVHVYSHTGSYHFDVGSVDITKDSVCVHVIRTNDPHTITNDLAGWLITVAVPDSAIEGCTSFDAVHDGYKESATTES